MPIFDMYEKILEFTYNTPKGISMLYENILQLRQSIQCHKVTVQVAIMTGIGIILYVYIHLYNSRIMMIFPKKILFH